MKKLLKLEKNSFTLLETLISVLILSIITVGINKSFQHDNFDKQFLKLNNLDNSFNINSFDTNFISSSTNIKIIFNETHENILNVKEIKYEDEEIKLTKYFLR